MNDQTQTAREDLAFLRGLAEDRGPIPAQVGHHFVAVGLIFGINVLWFAGAKAGIFPMPPGESFWGWGPGTLLYIPYSLWFFRRYRGITPGPTLKTFGFAWSAMGMMTLAIVTVILVAGARTGQSFIPIWPPIALALYGGVWWIIALVRRDRGDGIVAIGCFLFAVLAALVVGTPAMFAVLGAGLLLFFGGPGVRIMLKARR